MLPPPFAAMDLSDELAWLAVADWLEEHGRPDRAELVRLSRLLRIERDHPDRPAREGRLTELLASGVAPCVATLTNSIGMEFAYIPRGTFLMGPSSDEGVPHETTITRGFYLGVFAVTQGEYEAVMGTNPSHFSATGNGKSKVKRLKTDRFPVESVSYEDAVRFCTRLSAREGERPHQRLYRLPTAAEWEYACRGGTTSPFHFGDSFCSTQANFDGSYPSGGAAKGPCLRRTCAVGSYRPNGHGLFDMHGNVFEWCADWHGAVPDGPCADPVGPSRGSHLVNRGGSWYDSAEHCAAHFRGAFVPTDLYDFLGFRVLLPSAIG